MIIRFQFSRKHPWVSSWILWIPQKLVLHLSQFFPMTPGLQGHCLLMLLQDEFSDPRGWHLHTSARRFFFLSWVFFWEFVHEFVTKVHRKRTPTLLGAAPGHVSRNMAVTVLRTSLGDEAVQWSVGLRVAQRCLSVANFFEEIWLEFRFWILTTISSSRYKLTIYS